MKLFNSILYNYINRNIIYKDDLLDALLGLLSSFKR